MIALGIIGIFVSICIIVWTIISWKKTNQHISAKYDTDFVNFAKVMRVIFFIGMSCFCIYICCTIIDNEISTLGLGSDYDSSYLAETCSKCGSNKTEAYHSYYYNNGILCTGSDEYCRANADYTIAHCNNCSYSWKIYLK